MKNVLNFKAILDVRTSNSNSLELEEFNRLQGLPIAWKEENSWKVIAFRAAATMFRHSCASCSVESILRDDAHSLAVVADDRHDISLFCFGSSGSLSAPCIPEIGARLLSKWCGGDNDNQNGIRLGISCISTLDGLEVLVIFTNNQGTYCRSLTYRDDFVQPVCQDLFELTFLESGTRNSLPNARNLVILQNSHMVILVLDDDSLLISTGIGATASQRINPIAEKEANALNAEVTVDAICGSTYSNKFNLKAIDCCKLPTLSTSNKAYRSLRSDETLIQHICVCEMIESCAIIFLIESKSCLVPDRSHTTG